jgi:hypothetical protein
MIEDPIVEEIRRYRQEHSAKFDYDLEKICADLKERETQSKKEVIRRAPRLLRRKTGS